jgi:hypothetical protein
MHCAAHPGKLDHTYTDNMQGFFRFYEVRAKKPHFFGMMRIQVWSRRQESNLYLALRRHSFYPLNYDETVSNCKARTTSDRVQAKLRLRLV